LITTEYIAPATGDPRAADELAASGFLKNGELTQEPCVP
jgi:hypothetical protein